MAEGKYVLENTTIRRLNHIFSRKPKTGLHINLLCGMETPINKLFNDLKSIFENRFVVLSASLPTEIVASRLVSSVQVPKVT